MKTFLLSLAAMAAVAAAAPAASADPWNDGRNDGPHHYGAFHGDRVTVAYLDRLNWRITEAARDRRISWREAGHLRGALRDVRPLAWDNQTGQISPWEHRRLMRTVRDVEMRISDDRRTYGYGYGERYDWRR